MTQPQYGYPPQGGYPDPNAGQYGAPQGYAQPAPAPYQQPAPQQYPPNPYAPPAPQYGGYVAPGAYAQGQPMAPPAQPGVDLSGDLDSFYSQRQTGGGKGISWKGVPNGYTIQGVVARPIGNGDVFKETYPPNSPQAGQVRTNRDGSFKYAMQVPLKLMVLDQFQARDYPEGEARLFLRGGLRDEMTRAMAEVGAPEGPPEAGAFVRVTLTHRKPGNNIATNMFAVLYRSPGTWESDPTLQQAQQPAQQPQYAPQQPAPAGQVYGGAPQGPYQQQAPAQYAAPAQATPNPQQYAAPASMSQVAPQYGGPAYDPNQGQTLQQWGHNNVQLDPNQAQVQQQYPAQPPAATSPVPGVVTSPGVQQPYQAASNPQGQPAQQQYGQAAPQYAQQGQPQAPNTQAPAGAVNPGDQAALPGMPDPNQPPVQAGVQPSGLDPARQALLNRIAGQQGQPMGNPQQAQQPAQPQG